MKKLPRDISSSQLIKLLSKKYNYVITRQTGSHIRITTQLNGEYHITIPNHNPIKSGALFSILSDVANHHQKTKEEIIESLFD